MSRPAAFIFIILSLVFQLLTLICGKFASLGLAEFTPRAILTNTWYLASLACLALQALCWPLALRRFPLFWAYLFMSAIYIMIPPVSRFVFHEHVSVWNLAGAAIVAAGIALMSTGRGGAPDA